MGGLARALLDGIRLRCPACRAGRMSPRWWTLTRLHERCPRCDIPFVPGRGESVGGAEATLYASVLVGSLGVMLLAFAAVPLWALALWVAGMGVVGPVLTYRNFRGAWVGTMWGIAAWPPEGDPPLAQPAAARAWPWEEP